MWFPPPFLPSYPWTIAGLFAGFVILSVGSSLWTVGCVRVFLRGDWLAAVILAVGGVSIVPIAVIGRQAMGLWIGGGAMGYRLPVIGYVQHPAVLWIPDDGYVWTFVGFGLGLAGVGLASIGGLSQGRDLDREVAP